ncbi:histidine phosphatase family protein [Photobacterium sp. SDRW27]|uniref:SixA phosphatase family protein n=1 Tax=Photobacterium obscurum TaxID=2829490 RepID=UPI002242ECB1|nr:histidine phosphatase family protein [Photobacterium obscurum]MCW8328750.1 histidine phosphatase family protein [Photobacterium obscurum]
MKLLFLVRHAKSSWDDPTLDDHERPLNSRGMKNAPEMVHRLNAWQSGPQLIVSSSALRAVQTACFFSQGLTGQPKLETRAELYTESAFELFDLIKESSAQVDRLMMVGHNPAISDLGNMLGLATDNIPTCGVVVFGFEVDCWQAIASEQASTFYFDFPKRKSFKPEQREV